MSTPLPQDGVPIQSMADLKNMSAETLIDKLMQANRSLQEEKRQSSRKDAEMRAFVKQECDRLRSVTAQHTRDLEEQNNTLLKSLTRLQNENDKLKQENTTLQVKLEAALSRYDGVTPEAAAATRLLAPTSEPMHAGAPLSMPSPAPSLSGDPIPPKLPSSTPVTVVVQAHAAPQ